MMILRRASLNPVSFYPEFVRSRYLGVNQRVNLHNVLMNVSVLTPDSLDVAISYSFLM